MATSDAQNTGMDCKCHYNSIMFSVINIYNYHIVYIGSIVISSSADSGGIHVVPITCCSAVVIAAVPTAVLWCLVVLLFV